MKQIINVAGVLILIAVAIFGCLYIFGVMGFDTILSNLLKIVGAIILLGICWALVAVMMGGKE
jgi:hypothetical protein